jgi:RimJ/RimL family protein N-acetyltransferase
VFRLEAPIETERLTLRAFRPDDLEAVFEMRSRPDVVRYLYGDEQTRDQVAVTLAERLVETSLEHDGDALALAAERREDGRMIGDLTLVLRSAYHRQAEIGFVFHPDAQGQGYAREGAAAVLDVAFGVAGMHRVYGRTDGRNVASAGLMRRLGMRQEAHFRHNEIFKGEWGEELHFAILEDEWRMPPHHAPADLTRTGSEVRAEAVEG